MSTRLRILALALLPLAACTTSAPGGGGVYYYADMAGGGDVDATSAGTDATSQELPPAGDVAGDLAPDQGGPVDTGPDVPACTQDCCSSAADCGDGNACTTDICSPITGACLHSPIAGCVPTAAPCDEAHPCSGGLCMLSAHACVGCLTSADCGGSGLFCQGHECVSGTVCKSDVECKAAKQVCAKAEGACVDCNLAGDCGPGKACADHQCVAAAPCGSSKDCAKVCDLDQGVCVDCLSSDDCGGGQMCTSTHQCRPALCTGSACAGLALFACKPDGSGFAGFQDCDDGDPCTLDTCSATGCVHKPKSGGCDDGNACTENDACSAKGCVGSAVSCDDQNPCTSDSCSASSGCKHTAKSFGACDDGDACTTGEVCQGGTCQGTPLGCDDANPCTNDSCGAKTGCVHTNNKKACDDGSLCTTGDACLNGACTGSSQSCDDSNSCTVDSCSPTQGCQHTPGFGSCDDGNACTLGDSCDSLFGTCNPGVPKDCDDFNPCTTDSCSQGSCLHSPTSAACDDGDPCSTGDLCKGGVCSKGSGVQSCDDGNPCTDDSCKAGFGCTAVNNSAVCNDNNACTEGDKCSGGSCLAGAAKVCDDKNACTTDKCDPTQGCGATPDTAKCDDKNPCTTDTCAAPGGTCGHAAIAGCCLKASECDDGQSCTQDACAGNACVHKNTCCSGAGDCADANACTTDTCGADKSCSHVAGPAPSAVFTADFETGPEGWVAGTTLAYGWGAKTGKGAKTGQAALVFGPTASETFSGLKSATTLTVTSPEVQLQAGTAYKLAIAYRVDVTPVYDGALAVSVDVGAASPWVLLPMTATVTGQWNTATYDLTPVGGAKAKLLIKGTLTGTSTVPSSGTGVWIDAITITPQCTAAACTTNTDCPSSAPCSTGSCVAGACQYQFLCCSLSSQCDDKNACTTDSCSGAKCVHTKSSTCCSSDSECDDGQPCTWDACSASKCTHAAVAGCCTSDSQCDDADACSADLCGATHTCSHPALCCKVDGDCADGETTCTTDVCTAGKCVHAPTGAAGCCQPTLSTESFDGGSLPGWTFVNGAGAAKGWQLWSSATKTQSAPGVLYYGDPLVKNYDFSTSSGVATSPGLALPSGSKPTLRFWLYMDTEAGTTYDHLTVSIKTAAGSKTVWDKNAAGFEVATWVDVKVDLAAYVGQTVQVAFDFGTGDSVANSTLGVLVDDFRILNACP